MQRIFFAGVALLLSIPALAQAAKTLNFNEAIALARQSSPAVIAARLRVAETEARVIGASLRFRSNPTLDLEGGRRTGDVGSAEYGITVGQDIDLPQRRDARIAAAQAAVRQQELLADVSEGEVLREVALTFFQAVEAQERAAISATAMRLLDEAQSIAERRYAAGDVAQLDVNLARTAVARAEVEQRSSEAILKAQIAKLRILLGVVEEVMVEGSLAEASGFDENLLLGRAAIRPEVRALEAEIAETEAERRLAGLLRWPDFGVRASYAKEAEERVILAGVALTLPFFNRGQEAIAVASARLARLTAERDALVRSIEAGLRSGVEVLTALRAASTEYSRKVLPLVEENERLALESYEVGQIGLGDLLLVRREAIDARRALTDQLIQTRFAEVELRTQARLWPGVQ